MCTETFRKLNFYFCSKMGMGDNDDAYVKKYFRSKRDWANCQWGGYNNANNMSTNEL
jgi:hypothetical protein